MEWRVYWYIGVHVGEGKNDTSGIFDSAGSEADLSTLDGRDLVYGLQAGYNIQKGHMVYGIEVSYSEMDLDEKTPVDDEGNWHKLKMDEYWGIRAKVGHLVNNDNTLIYLTAGYAEIDSEIRVELPESPGSGETNKKGFTTDAWTLGLGVEHAVTEAVSIKAEALWMDLDEKVNLDLSTLDDADSGDHLSLDDMWVLQVGINYNF